MRLKDSEIAIIKMEGRKQFGRGAKFFIFGSRADDKKRGGDIDIYIETDVKRDVLKKKIKFLVDVKKEIGERKIDAVINNHTSKKLIYDVAKSEGIRI